MAIPKTRAELLAGTQAEYAKLQKLVVDMPTAQAMLKREDDTSIKDIVAHRAHWIALFLGWFQDGQAGRNVHIPAKGYKWNDLKRYNADLRADQAGLGWDDAKAQLIQAHVALIDVIETATDQTLYGGPMAGANNAWTTGRWAQAAGLSHYRSAAKWIRACLRADAGP
jgi:hypothetical protein